MDSEEVKEIVIVILAIACIILGIICFHYKPSSDEGELIDLALIGKVHLWAVDSNSYKIRYNSFIDKVKTEAIVNGPFELGQVKALTDAAINKKFESIKLPKECLLDLVTNTSSLIPGNSKICEVYGDYNTTLEIYDRDLWVDDLIDKKVLDKRNLASLVKR